MNFRPEVSISVKINSRFPWVYLPSTRRFTESELARDLLFVMLTLLGTEEGKNRLSDALAASSKTKHELEALLPGKAIHLQSHIIDSQPNVDFDDNLVRRKKRYLATLEFIVCSSDSWQSYNSSNYSLELTAKESTLTAR